MIPLWAWIGVAAVALAVAAPFVLLAIAGLKGEAD